jgi:hypothetical protein
MPTQNPSSPKVFISYSHDSPEHDARVLAFADALRGSGIDALIDQYVPVPPEGWPRWMERNLREADFVLMVCTETYHRRVVDKEQPGKGRGVLWEATLIYNDLYLNAPLGHRYLPILFDPADAKQIPAPAAGHTHFTLHDFTLADPNYEALYRHLTGQPATPKPDLGAVASLPPRPRLAPSPRPASAASGAGTPAPPPGAVSATGAGSVSIGGSANGATIVTGNHAVSGNVMAGRDIVHGDKTEVHHHYHGAPQPVPAASPVLGRARQAKREQLERLLDARIAERAAVAKALTLPHAPVDGVRYEAQLAEYDSEIAKIETELESL